MKKGMIGLFLISLFCISFAVAAIPGDCNPTPISYRKFDGDASDSVNGNNDGVGEGSINYGFGRVNNALNLDSPTPLENVKINHDSSLTPASGLSVEFWFQKTADSPGVFLVSKQGYKILLSGVNVQAQIGGSTLTSTTTIVSGTWYYVVVTWDGSTANLYVDGSTAEDTQSSVAVTYSTDNLYTK